MTTETNSFYKAFVATAAALAQGIRVKVDSSGNILVAGATDPSIGVTTEAVAASGVGNVKLFGPTMLMTAGAAIARGALLYPLASGKVDDTGTLSIQMVALEAATADGDIIECAHIRVGS